MENNLNKKIDFEAIKKWQLEKNNWEVDKKIKIRRKGINSCDCTRCKYKRSIDACIYE